jgi:hypothetical protein
VSDASDGVSVERLMRAIEEDVRRERRTRLLARGGPGEYRDAEVYAAVEGVLRRAIESRDRSALLLPELMGDEPDWKLQLPLKFTTHRGAVGQAIVFIKRRLLLPLTRWLYEYSLENFRRQQRVNGILFACIEELAIENARLREKLGERPPT